MRTRLKVCCIASPEEARLAMNAGADALGLVARMPSGPGPVGDDQISAIAAMVPPPVASFLLTCETEPHEVIAHAHRTRVSTLQLVDDTLDERVWRAIRRELPAIRIVQVVHVRGEGSIRTALDAAPFVDALLLDSGNPAAKVRELGGTGRIHDWSISRRIVEASPVPVFLAGGLNAQNVGEAMLAVRPFGIDLCSGVRSNGRLDEGKLSALVKAMRDADARLGDTPTKA